MSRPEPEQSWLLVEVPHGLDTEVRAWRRTAHGVVADSADFVTLGDYTGSHSGAVREGRWRMAYMEEQERQANLYRFGEWEPETNS